MTPSPSVLSPNWRTRSRPWSTPSCRRLEVERDQPEVVLGGGLFDGAYGGLAGRVEALVSAVAPGARYRRLGAPPVLGSALLALDAFGATPDADGTARAAAVSG